MLCVLLLILLYCTAAALQMLYRAIVLTWAVGWTIDRLYEAGADETVGLLGWQLATPQAGAVLAAIGCTTVSLALLVQVSWLPGWRGLQGRSVLYGCMVGSGAGWLAKGLLCLAMRSLCLLPVCLSAMYIRPGLGLYTWPATHPTSRSLRVILCLRPTT